MAPAAVVTVQGGAANVPASEGKGTDQEQGQRQDGMGGGEKEDDNGEAVLGEDDQQHSQLFGGERHGQIGEAADNHESWFT